MAFPISKVQANLDDALINQQGQIDRITKEQLNADSIKRVVTEMITSDDGDNDNSLKAMFVRQGALLAQLAAQSHVEEYCGAVCKASNAQPLTK